MCKPLQQERDMQQAQPPIVVQTEQQEAVVQQQTLQQVPQQQMQQQAQQEQVQQQAPQEQEQQPAAPIDAAPAQTQFKKKKENIATISRSQVRQNYSDVRKNAFHAQLLLNVNADMALRGSKQYKAVMQALKEYASMDLEATSTDHQSAVLVKICRLLRQHPAAENAQDAESVIINRYRMYFNTFTNGELELPEDMEQVCSVQYDQQDIELTPIVAGIKPSWVDVTEQPLFAHEPSVNDIQQRALGDCYLQSAISSLVLNSPKTLKQCLRDNGDGTVTVRFFKKGYDIFTDLPTAYQKKAMENDLTKLSDEDLLVRMFVNWRKADPEEYTLLRNKYNSLTNSPPANLGIPDLGALLTKLADDFDKEQDAGKKEVLSQQIYMLPMQHQQLIVEKVGLKGLVSEMSLNRLPQAEQLAALICQDPGFTPVLDAIRAARNSGANVLTALDQVMQTFSRCTQAMEQLKQNHADLFDPTQGEAVMHPVYVTVKKTVPRLAGVDAYAANSLWMQMIEKAYAASGLHIDNINIRKQPHRSYEQIEGGFSGVFLETLTGIPLQRIKQNGILPSQPIFDQGGVLNPLSDQTLQPEKEKDKIDPEIRTVVMRILQSELQRRYLIRHTTKGKNKQTIEYALSAITIEDLQETIMDWRNWSQSNISTQQLQAIKQKHPQADKYIDAQMRNVAKFLNKYYSNLDIPSFEHRRFAQKKDGTPKYTRWAEQQYATIQQALQNRKAVTAGTQEFIPKEVQGNGLNGESLTSGLAQRHAYSVVGCEEIDGRKYVTLRNPWARFERQYVKITETDGRVHYDVKANAQGMFSQSRTSGTFHMELNDFMGSIDKIYIN